MLSFLKSVGRAIVGPLVGGFISKSSQRETNRANQQSVSDTNLANREAVELTNAANLRAQEMANATTIEQAEKDRALQREFAQHGVRWKVEDAKAAGLHPLFGLGGQTTSYTPQGIRVGASRSEASRDIPFRRDVEDMGQDVTRAIQAIESPQERERRALLMENLKAQTSKELAIASFYNSKAARERVTSNSSQAVPVPAKTWPMGARPSNEQLKVVDLQNYWNTGIAEPDRIVSQRSGRPEVTAATHSFWREYHLGGGLKVMLPFSEEGPSEALQDAGPAMLMAILAKNEGVYGKDYAKKVYRYLFPMFGMGRDAYYHSKQGSIHDRR